MPPRPRYRAGRGVAEDAKRALQRAIHFVGLKEHKVRMILGEDQRARLVMGGGKPEGWRYELPPLSVEVLVTTNGEVLPAKVFCKASDQDPAMAVVGGVLKRKGMPVWAGRPSEGPQGALGRATGTGGQPEGGREEIHSFKASRG
jgi:hypothetical protein